MSVQTELHRLQAEVVRLKAVIVDKNAQLNATNECLDRANKLLDAANTRIAELAEAERGSAISAAEAKARLNGHATGSATSHDRIKAWAKIILPIIVALAAGKLIGDIL